MTLTPRRFDRDVGLVLLTWTVLGLVELFVVGIRWRTELAGSWETFTALKYLLPLGIAATIPIAIALVAIGKLVRARQSVAVAIIVFVAAAELALGVTTGRHFHDIILRSAFVGLVSIVAGSAAFALVRTMPLGKPSVVAIYGAPFTIIAWLANLLILPRLYPAFHIALFVLALVTSALVVLPLRPSRAAPWIGLAGIVVACASLAWSPRAPKAVAGSDNLRRVLLEHAPFLGRSVKLAAILSPPPALDDASLPDPFGRRTATSGRALDWSGHDVVLLTIDALRADHVGAYGYTQATTPNIDRLAARGVRFTHAYAPTPHTSYSVASMMAGKYMRPLLAMGANDDVETWPMYLRRYGYRTAAFYPPAVFFIDEHRFQHLQSSGLGFEYRKEEFTTPELRKEQIERYLAKAPKDKPLFLWVHSFEPHEPYEMHDEHPFPEAYDSEIATADALVGDVVALVEKRRPGAIVIVTADHGEEFGDHGGRYHGTTVYEEQVRVPLVVVGPGIGPRVVSTPAQTIDLLPTTLTALDIPRPAKLRGRDLGALLAGKGAMGDEGLAFAETDDYTMVASADDRLVCARKIASCTLYDVASDPAETRPVVDRPDRVSELTKLTAAIERENGKLEANAAPEALRRCLQGDRDAAAEVAPLFDDAKADIRKSAARCAFHIRAKELIPQLKRAAEKDDDDGVKAWAGIALVRNGEAPSYAEAGLHATKDVDLRRAAALAIAERGDARGEGELVAWWSNAFAPDAKTPGELDDARDVLAALGTIRAKTAVPVLVRSLEEVRTRPYVVDALAAIGDPKAKEALLAAFTNERYVNVRPIEAKALLKLGAREELNAPLARFAGVVDPMIEAVAIAAQTGLLRPNNGGWSSKTPFPKVNANLKLGGAAGPARLLIVAAGDTAPRGTLAGAAIGPVRDGDVWIYDAEEVAPGRVPIALEHPEGITAVWLVRLTEEIPPPLPRPWDGGASSPDP